MSFSYQLNGQIFPVDNILLNGDTKKFVNVVFLSEGYKTEELEKYVNDVQKASNYFFTVSPFKEYKSYFNVMAIKVPSKETGTDHPRSAPDCPAESVHPLLAADTYFNSTFDSNSIHRLLVTTNYSAVNNVIINNFPLFDQKIMLVNTNYYGGSGGSTSVASLHSSTNELVMHESGHTFAGLADEYWAGDGYASEKVNMTKETNPELVKWKNWLGVDGVGIYQHGTSGVAASWYRPHNNCKMRALGVAFCPVCREELTLKILQKFGTPVKSFQPLQPEFSVSTETVQFKLNLYKPNPNTLRTKWFLNGVAMATNSDSLKLKSNQFANGNNVLSVQVLDTTSFIRSEKHTSLNTYTVNWTIQKQTTDAGIIQNSPGFKVYPNPVSDEMVIEIIGKPLKSKFEICNNMGQIVLIGFLNEKTKIQTRGFVPGIYIVKVENNNGVQIERFIKE